MAEPRQRSVEQPYGCDRCGSPRDAHEGDDLACPGRSAYSRDKWRQNDYWTDDGHALSATLSYGNVSPLLIHPEGGCKAPHCLCQGEEYVERDPDPNCENCHGTGSDPTYPCWLKIMADDLGSEFFEQTEWRPEITLGAPIPILYYGDPDTFEWRPRVIPS